MRFSFGSVVFDRPWWHMNTTLQCGPTSRTRSAWKSRVQLDCIQTVSQFVCNGNNWNQQPRYVLSNDWGPKIACQYERYVLKPPHTAALIRPRTHFMNFTVLCAVQHLGNAFIRPNVDAFRLLPARTHFVVGSCGTVSHNAKSTASTCEPVQGVCYFIYWFFCSVNPKQPLGNLQKWLRTSHLIGGKKNKTKEKVHK